MTDQNGAESEVASRKERREPTLWDVVDGVRRELERFVPDETSVVRSLACVRSRLVAAVDSTPILEDGTDPIDRSPTTTTQRRMTETTPPPDSTADPQAIYNALCAEIEHVLVGNDDAIELLTIALLTRGHLLLEGVPGVAKTTLANIFARASGLEYNRVQMTPDILPADITGTQIYRENTGTFDLQRGPVFANLVVTDEINRATPKTQSALLEAMAERHVTIGGETLDLPEPFMVVATQNPIEMEGVFELPEAQRDRFQFKHTIELPDRADERELIERFDTEPDLGPETIEQVVGVRDLLGARNAVPEIYVAQPVKAYVLDLVTATRGHPDVAHGASPRATLAFLSGIKARAAIHGREYAIPDDVKALAEPILIHRLVLATDAELSDVSPDEIVRDIVDSVEPPGAETTSDGEMPAMSDGGDDAQDED